MKLKYWARAALLPVLLPLAYRDGKRVLAAVPRLPDAREPAGTVPGPGPAVRVLLIGESTMAGVGVATHDRGFAGHLARTLGAGWSREVQWWVEGHSGFTLKRLLAEVIPDLPPRPADLIVLGMGANEAFKMNTPAGFRRDMRATLTALRQRFGTGVPILIPNMPPIREFPAFTPVLRFTLGNMIECFGAELERLIPEFPRTFFDARLLRRAEWEERSGVRGAEHWFSDGVHPSELTYRHWAQDFGAFILDHFPRATDL